MKNNKKRKLQKATPYLFLLPFFGIFIMFSLFPILYSLVISFTKMDGIGNMEFIGLDNYIRLFTQDKVFLKSIGNTILIMLITMPLPLITGLIIAVLIKDFFKRTQKIVQLANFLPYITTPVAIGFLFQLMFDWQTGTVNQILEVFGVGEPINWLGSAVLARIVMVILIWWRYYGYFMVMLMAGLSTIPESLYEAADLDGARWHHKFFRITIPMLRPVLLFLITTSIIGGLQIFDEPRVLFSGPNMPMGGPDNSVLLLVMYFYDTAFKRFDLGYGSAVAFVLIILIMIFSMAFSKFTSRGEES